MTRIKESEYNKIGLLRVAKFAYNVDEDFGLDLNKLVEVLNNLPEKDLYVLALEFQFEIETDSKIDFTYNYDYDNTLQKARYRLNHPSRRRKLFN